MVCFSLSYELYSMACLLFRMNFVLLLVLVFSINLILRLVLFFPPYHFIYNSGVALNKFYYFG